VISTFERTELLSRVSGIIDPYNLDWPRSIQAMNGITQLNSPPERILTVSVGHDEMLLGFLSTGKLIATSSFSQDPTGNIFQLTDGLPVITSEIETIIAQSPDLVFADPYANTSLLEGLKDLGIPVIQTKLQNDINGRIDDIILAGYVTDELDSAFTLIDQINLKINTLNDYKKLYSSDVSTKILAVTYYDAYWAGGIGSTEGSIIELAGGINVAAEAGVESNNMITKEALISMAPEVIVIPQSSKWGGDAFYDDLLSDTTLASIPAILNNRVHIVPTKYFTTLSHWNIRGAEELFKILWSENMSQSEIDNLADFTSCIVCY
jgi:iron complex transport system substrate-binding protein